MATVLRRAAAIGARGPHDLTTEFLARFAAARAATVTANTVLGDLSYLSAAAGYAVEEGWLVKRPNLMRVRPRPTRSMMRICHSLEDVSRVLALLRQRSGSWEGNRLHALAATVAYCALRRDEALTLQVTDVDALPGLLTVTDRTRRKTAASAATIPIPPPLIPILAAWLPICSSPWVFPGVRLNGPWTGGACGVRACDRLRQAGEACGVQGLTFQSLRHSWATCAAWRWGMSPEAIRAILRHTSPATQRLYIHADHQALIAAVASVSYQA